MVTGPIQNPDCLCPEIEFDSKSGHRIPGTTVNSLNGVAFLRNAALQMFIVLAPVLFGVLGGDEVADGHEAAVLHHQV